MILPYSENCTKFNDTTRERISSEVLKNWNIISFRNENCLLFQAAKIEQMNIENGITTKMKLFSISEIFLHSK